MKASAKRILAISAFVLIVVLILAIFWHYQSALIATAYVAKTLASGVFVSGRPAEDIRTEDLEPFGYVDADIDYEQKGVTAAILGLAARKAIYREDLGCTLVIGFSEEEIRSQVPDDWHPAAPEKERQPWYVLSDSFASEINPEKLDRVLNTAFSEPDPELPRRSRAVVVVYKGRLLAERYAKGISADTPLLGWSMTKSVTNALVAILVKQGRLDIMKPASAPEWRDPGDPRGRITLDQMLRMSSGLGFDEAYDNPRADVVRMLFGLGDCAGFAAGKSLRFPQDSVWYYSSGTTNIISRIIRHAVGGDLIDYFSFPHRELFHKIGMRSAVLEPDASGNFVGSSFMYATARDWARFGLLCLQDGAWQGERVLPEGWIAYSTIPTPKSRGRYGAHFWLNAGASWLPDAPEDLFAMRGHDGQTVTIIPSHELVVVRLGHTPDPRGWSQSDFIKDILAVLF